MRRTIISPIALMALMALMGCSDDTEPVQPRTTVELVPCAQAFVEEEPITTRSWTPPTGYDFYDALNPLPAGQESLNNKTIGIFFTKGDGTAEPGTFFYGSDSKWRSSVEITASGTYYLYGFIPYPSGVTASVSPSVSGGYPAGAVLTLNNLPTVTPSDVCVVVGAKEGNDPESTDQYEVTGLTTGQFAYSASSSNIYLLFDHIYSALNFKLKVDAEYAELRTIRLKTMTLQPYNGSTPASATTNVTVTLTANDTGATPITAVTYTPTGSDTSAQPLFQSTEANGTELTTTATAIRGCFVPVGINQFDLTSTYDVYDRKGNLIRQNCTATNHISIASVFGGKEITRGKMFSVSITVIPTYLYVLSDPDLDNPTFNIDDD